MISARSERAFFAVSALVFVISAAVTIGWCASMSSMGGMPMPGGWTMSTAWMRMPGQTWLGASSSFIGMWAVMMAAMMLPSLMPMLSGYRRAVECTTERRLGLLTTIVGAAYFCVWIALGIAAFPVGVALAALEMQSQTLSEAVPMAIGVIVVIAGALQFSSWKARHLACCRHAAAQAGPLPAEAETAWRHGIRLGLHCIRCCANLTAILVVLGVMDLRVMALVTLAITVERLAPHGDRIARATGALMIAAGFALVARATGI